MQIKHITLRGTIKQIMIRNILNNRNLVYCRTKIKFTTSKKDFKNRFAINQNEVKIFVIERCKFLISFIMYINNVILMIVLINIFNTIHNNLIHQLIIIQMFK